MGTTSNFSKKDAESRKKFTAGLNESADVIASTMGPGGHTVIVHSTSHALIGESGSVMRHDVLSSMDGVTVARQLNPADPIKNLATKMIVDGADKTVRKEGDGTTSTVVLIREGYNLMEVSQFDDNIINIGRGMEAAVCDVKEIIRENAIEIVNDEGEINQEMLLSVATVSANNDEVLGKMVADTVGKVGVDGVVMVRAGTASEDVVIRDDGYVFNSGYISPYFINYPQNSMCKLKNPYIVLVDEVLDDEDVVVKILKNWVAYNYEDTGAGFQRIGEIHPLVIIASDIHGPAIATCHKALRANSPGTVPIPMVVIKAPMSGRKRTAILEDIAKVTAAKCVYNKLTGTDTRHFGDGGDNVYGIADEIVVTKNKTVIKFSEKTVGMKEELISQIKQQISEYGTEDAGKDFLKTRLAMLTSGIAMIEVGGNSQVEINVRRDLVEDAQKACFSALRGGVVPGCGKMLYNISKIGFFKKESTSGYSDEGYQLVMKAMLAPIRQVLKNAGYSFDDASIESHFPVENHGDATGINVLTGENVDMIEAGIIDPANVVIASLENSMSVVRNILTTDYFVLVS